MMPTPTSQAANVHPLHDSSELPAVPAEWQAAGMVTLPLLGAMLIDVADFFSLGPQGIAIGALVGAPCAWWVAKTFGLSQKSRLVAALAAAIYCAVPFTELIPAATILAGATELVRYGRTKRTSAA